MNASSREMQRTGSPSEPHGGFSESLTAILRCPTTHRALQWMEKSRLDDLNAAIARGVARHVDGTAVPRPLDAALEVEGIGRAYGVVDGIAILLPSSAILLGEPEERGQPGGLAAIKGSVQSFYDDVGWRADAAGVFTDAALYEDLRPVASEYLRRCHARVGRHLAPRGRYLLDVASGPIQYDDYLAYSEGYELRVCIDLSIRALRAARAKLGSRGAYLLGDITALPLSDESMGGVVSLHTIYHVPAEEQETALREIHRVLEPGARAAVVYSWGKAAWLAQALSIPARATSLAARTARALTGYLAGEGAAGEELAPRASALYFRPHGPRWMKRQLQGLKAQILTWRSVDVSFLQFFVHERLGGRALLRGIYALEEACPRLLGRLGQYPLVVIEKETSAASARPAQRSPRPASGAVRSRDSAA